MLSMGIRQSFDVLQMNVFDLKSFLEKELEENYLGELVYYHNNEKMEFDIVDNRDSLESAFLRQLQYNSEINQVIAQLILANCDSSGYLRCSEKDLAKSNQLSLDEIQKTRQIILNSEPYGISSLNLKECLLVQVNHIENNKKLKQLIHNHLEDLGNAHYHKIKNKMKLNDEQLNELIERIHKLNPRPGLQYHLEQIIFIKPDILLEIEDEELTLTPIRYYGIERVEMNTQHFDSDALKYHRMKNSRISFLKECLLFRENTLLQISKVLVETQKRYLLYNECKEVLRLKDIKEKTGLSIATISKALKDKYLEYDGKTFALKSLLSKEINELSVDFIQRHIQEIVQNEGIISDRAVSEKLSQMGISCSRRTVSKYRAQLHVPSSVQKRRITNEN